VIKFSDLVVGAKFEVRSLDRNGREEWHLGEVAYVAPYTRTSSAIRLGVGRETRRACVRVTSGRNISHYFFEDMFQGRAGARIRLPTDLLVAGPPASEADADRLLQRNYRQAAKPMNFGGRMRPMGMVEPPKVDGLDRHIIYNRFKLAQREDASARALPPLTPAQKAVAGEMWAAELKLESLRAERKKRETETSVYVEIDPED
jgi:hypothetical protein